MKSFLRSEEDKWWQDQREKEKRMNIKKSEYEYKNNLEKIHFIIFF